MILSVTPNPALDRVHVTQGFQPGRQSRAVRTFLQPGGSGVHATAVAQAFGVQTLAIVLLGGHTGSLWQREAEARGLVFDHVPIEGETRQSFCLIDLEVGSQVEAVEAGPQFDESCLPELLKLLSTHLPQAELVILSGSLPPGLPPDSYARMIDLARGAGIPVLLDAHSEPLHLALPSRPWMIKPNLAEFHALIGSESTNLAERAEASRELSRRGGLVVALSMGVEGLLLTTPDGQWRLSPPESAVHLPGGTGRNTIGCGDALVGALTAEYSRTRDLLAAARLGIAAANQNLGTLGVPEVEPKEVSRLVKEVSVFILPI
jgi:1-phosphofructokinase family hexose kinase